MYSVFVCQLRTSFTSFGQLLCCAHERIVNIMKVYIERKNMQLELIRFRKKYDFIDVGNFEVGIYFRGRHVYETGLIAIRDVLSLFFARQFARKVGSSINSTLSCCSSLLI